MIATQAVIAVCGVTAVWLSQDERPQWRRWSSVFGLLGQPAWFVETYQNQQYGILALCILYTASWGRGFWACWIKARVPA